MKIKWEDGSFSYLRLFQTPILDENGEIDVNYYIYQDRTPEVTQSEYMDVHVQRIAASLESLATGNKDGLQLDVNDADVYTKEMRAQFVEIFNSVQTSTVDKTGTVNVTLTPGKTWSDFLKLNYDATVSYGTATYKWDFNGEGSPEAKSGTFTFGTTGTKTITVTATPPKGVTIIRRGSFQES